MLSLKGQPHPLCLLPVLAHVCLLESFPFLSLVQLALLRLEPGSVRALEAGPGVLTCPFRPFSPAALSSVFCSMVTAFLPTTLRPLRLLQEGSNGPHSGHLATRIALCAALMPKQDPVHC